MFKFDKLMNIFKENKKLVYAVNVFILLIILSFILKLDSSNTVNNPVETLSAKNHSKEDSINEYLDSLESKIENMIGKIQGVKSVDVMIYTKSSPILEPIFDVNTTSERNTETGSDGTRREVERDTNQNKVVKGSDNEVVEKYLRYPEITGVLIVVDYNGDKDIRSILLNSVKTLFNIKINNIEIVLSKD